MQPIDRFIPLSSEGQTLSRAVFDRLGSNAETTADPAIGRTIWFAILADSGGGRLVSGTA